MSLGTKNPSHQDTEDQIQTLCIDREVIQGQAAPSFLVRKCMHSIWVTSCLQKEGSCVLFTCVHFVLFFPPSKVPHTFSFRIHILWAVLFSSVSSISMCALFSFFPLSFLLFYLLLSFLPTFSFLICLVSLSAPPSLPHVPLTHSSGQTCSFPVVSPLSSFHSFPLSVPLLHFFFSLSYF